MPRSSIDFRRAVAPEERIVERIDRKRQPKRPAGEAEPVRGKESEPAVGAYRMSPEEIEEMLKTQEGGKVISFERIKREQAQAQAQAQEKESARQSSAGVGGYSGRAARRRRAMK